MFQEIEQTSAYAKIQGKNFIKLIQKLVVYLGREAVSTIVDLNNNEEILFISNSNKISRKHLKIYYDKDKCEWYALNLSKNHVFINKTVLKSTDEPRLLSPISSIQIDDCKFYFFQSRGE